MKGVALLHSLSWFQISLALHAALGLALYTMAPFHASPHALDQHSYRVSLLNPEEVPSHRGGELVRMDGDPELGFEWGEIEQHEPDTREPSAAGDGIYDGPPVFDEAGLLAADSSINNDVQPEAHDHQMVRGKQWGKCKSCKKPNRFRMRCSHPGCSEERFGGHICLVARSGGGAVKPKK